MVKLLASRDACVRRALLASVPLIASALGPEVCASGLSVRRYCLWCCAFARSTRTRLGQSDIHSSLQELAPVLPALREGLGDSDDGVQQLTLLALAALVPQHHDVLGSPRVRIFGEALRVSDSHS
jgi:hypothetical protein